MILVSKLAVSRPMYAFNRDTWRMRGAYGGGIDAAWFKRKNGILVATMGSYHPMVERRENRPTNNTYHAWITAADDNRYGGSWLAQWNGLSLLNYDRPTPEVTAARIAFLQPMLLAYPCTPVGYEGWWTFPRGER